MSERILIAALSADRVIGHNGALPWRLPEDLKRFKRLTLGEAVLMGRKTWDSLGKPLPERENWVLTRDSAFTAAGARTFHDLDQALAAHAGGQLMIIGGADLYRQTLPLATRLELTEVHASVEGDALFPALDPKVWQEVAREAHPADERHAYSFSFVTLLRRTTRAASKNIHGTI